jgi:predicted alpha/beta superfamily hydrolase
MEHSTVVGNIIQLDKVWSPQLENERDILVYLPPSYDEGELHYPVVYMHDGQNLFDEATSFSGEWEVDETLERLSRRGLEAIVVGIPNLGEERLNECCPFDEAEQADARGELYLAWIVETLKPLIDRSFRTLPDRVHTGMMGSSMGGLITLFAFFRYPEIFGFAGVMSPSLWFAERAIFPCLEEAPYVPGRLYLDVGTAEGEGVLEDARRMRDLLVQKGYRLGEDLLYIEEEGAEHTESAWAGRAKIAFRLLLGRLPLFQVRQDHRGEVAA